MSFFDIKNMGRDTETKMIALLLSEIWRKIEFVVAAILKSKMADIWSFQKLVYVIRGPRKCRYRNCNEDSNCFSFQDMMKNRFSMAAILKSKMAAVWGICQLDNKLNFVALVIIKPKKTELAKKMK